MTPQPVLTINPAKLAQNQAVVEAWRAAGRPWIDHAKEERRRQAEQAFRQAYRDAPDIVYAPGFAEGFP